METQEKTLTADLRHTIRTADAEGNTLIIEIRLNDECKNGHQDFSITGSLYEKNKPLTDRYYIRGGAIGDYIAQQKPELAIFNRLHLCDWEGIPMYAVENGFYHLKTGFNSTKPSDSGFNAEFCEYYRVTPEQFDTLNKCHNKTQYACLLKDLGILAQWKQEANEAIKVLEEMTGNEFLPASTRSQYDAPTLEEVADDLKKVNSGYYTADAIKAREEAAKQAFVDEIRANAKQKANAELKEAELKIQLYLIGGEKAMDNTIFYNHTKEVKFNWRNYGDELTESEIENIKSKLVLPKGFKYEN